MENFEEQEYEAITFKKITEEIEKEHYMGYATQYARFTKIMNILGQDIEELKNEKEEIVFAKQEKELIKALILETSEEFLKRVYSKNPNFKDIAHKLKASEDMRIRLEKLIETIDDEEVRAKGKYIVDVLSRRNLIEVEKQVIEKVKDIGEEIIKLDLNSNQLTEVLKEIDEGLDKFKKNLLEKYQK